jgi:RNA-directed DNA polymerase
MARTPSRGYMSTGQQRIAELAEQCPQVAFTTLAHHMNLTLLLHAFHATRKDGAPGVDGLTGEDYSKNLLDNLRALLDRAKSGSYRAPPVRRVHIPKGTGRETRPLGILRRHESCSLRITGKERQESSERVSNGHHTTRRPAVVR